MTIIEARNVEKKYSDQYALNNVSISVPKGCIFGLLGPNGAGKTSLLRIINRITAIDNGEIVFKGQKMTNTDLANIGYLPEERGLYKKMKVGEQLLYLAQLKGLSKNDALARLKFRLEEFEIMSWWNKTIEELSKGMQQKVQFINTIIHEPELLIFDEPFSGFDPINANIFKKEILALRDKGASIILSTHDMSSVEEMCDYICLINNAETILEGELGKIREGFKSNIFNISLKGKTDKDFGTSNGFSVLEMNNENGNTIIRVQAEKQIEGDVLLHKLTKKHKIISFTEELPSMKDVFIKAVKNRE